MSMKKEEFITKALKISLSAHYHQVDKAGQPYILHPIRVATNVVKMKQARDQDKTALYVIALLHDVVEDTPVSLKELQAMGFPHPILAAVELLTKRPEDKKDPSNYYTRIKKNRLARLVKLADIGDNSDPVRLKQLPLEKQIELKAKYRKALKYLE